MVFHLPPSVRKPVYAVIALLVIAFDVITLRDILNGRTDTTEGMVMLLGSLIILFLLGRKFTAANKG